MGFLGSLLGWGKSRGEPSPRHVSDEAFRENLSRQTRMSPQTVALLRKHGATDTTTLKLQYFFYTDTKDKAEALASALQALQYQVGYGPSAGDRQLFTIKGWTGPILMTDESVVAWTQQMCRLGFQHDCEFDGWGTNPEP